MYNGLLSSDNISFEKIKIHIMINLILAKKDLLIIMPWHKHYHIQCGQFKCIFERALLAVYK